MFDVAKPNPELSLSQATEAMKTFGVLFRNHIKKVDPSSTITQGQMEAILQDAIDITVEKP